MKIEGNIITAEDGKVLRRIRDQYFFGNELHLGYTHRMYGAILQTPILELPEHYEEIDEPIDSDISI